MRNLFRSYYNPSNEEFSKIWQECHFSFDANVLLNIYRYSPQTRERFFEILERLQDRIWIPYQAAHEYHENRLNVISTQMHAYQEIQGILNEFLGSKVLDQLRGRLSKFKRHSFINIDSITSAIENSLKNTSKKAKKLLVESESKHPDLITFDPFRERLSDILDDRVGIQYELEKLNELYQESEKRFISRIPPGYEDAKNKDAPDKYGDYVVWRQLIDYGIQQKKPLILVTDDLKEDWWQKHEGKTLGPRRELLEEFWSEAEVQFWMYSSSAFMQYAEKFLEIPHYQEVLDEAEEISLANDQSHEGFNDSELTFEEANNSISKPINPFTSGNAREVLKGHEVEVRESGLDKASIPVAQLLEHLSAANSSIQSVSRELKQQFKNLDPLHATSLMRPSGLEAIQAVSRIPDLDAIKSASRIPNFDAVKTAAQIPNLDAVKAVAQIPSLKGFDAISQFRGLEIFRVLDSLEQAKFANLSQLESIVSSSERIIRSIQNQVSESVPASVISKTLDNQPKLPLADTEKVHTSDPQEANDDMEK